jgi:M6 family metalloprotease-like protein
MKKAFSFLFLFFICATLFSAPLENEPVTVTQPDGVVLNIFASGDEFYNWLHDKDGFTIIQDGKTGYYVFAKLENKKIIPTNFIVGRVNPAFSGLLPGVRLPDEEILKIRNAHFANTPKDMGDAPKTGIINNLIVFIRFSDDAEFSDLISYYKGIFNNDTSGKNSMFNYFKNVSYNSLFVTSTFYPVPTGTSVISYKDSHPRSYFKPYDSTSNPNGYTSSNATSREHTLLKDAVNYVASQVPTTLNLDGDNDGKVDNVCFIVNGATTAWATLLWPHMWSLYSYTVNINGKRVYDYNFQIQNHLKSSGPGVLCHEMGHSLGAPDLYRYVNTSISPCSTWDLMCSNTNPPQHMGAYMKWKYATWISSLPIISTPGVYTLKPITSQTNNCYRINSPFSTTEYFVVEFRRKALPFENTIPGSGLLVYRINTLASGNANGPPDEVYIYRPGGTLTANGTPTSAHYSNLVGRTSIRNFTNPSPFLSNGSQGGLNIYNITSYDTLISFTLGVSSGIQQTNSIASEYKLMQNYPNPFNPETKINFQIKESGFVTLKIYDILGKEVTTLVNENLNSGVYEINWNAKSFTSGVYFYKLETEKFSDVKKMLMVK